LSEKKSEDTVQNIPSVDSDNTEPFEGLVETYFQSKGYISSSNKWFWYWQEGKQQRGYKDIDVLAINSKETVLIDVTGELIDKIGFDIKGNLKSDNLNKLFYKEIKFLESVPQYSWLLEKRKIRKIIAYVYGKPLSERLIKNEEFLKSGIELLSSDRIIEDLKEYNQKKFLKTNNSIMKMIQLFIKKRS